jgi:anti-sigma factor RsiW
MTCADVGQLLDAFVDAELPAPMLLAIARHAGSCAACDAAVRELTVLHETVERSARDEAESLDLSGVWPTVSRRIERVEGRRVWSRRLRVAPAVGIGLAAAASAVLWFRAPAPGPIATPEPAQARIASRPRPNQAVIERLDSEGARFELRRERKYGTTIIMVSADGEPGQ